jgi:hypothetical protein
MTPARARWKTCGALLAAGIAVAGMPACAIFTDLDVDAYKLGDASSDAHASDANVCDTGACPTVSLACVSSANCDKGSVCCLAVAGPDAAILNCQTSCPSLSYQLCANDAECGGEVHCIQQMCPVSGVVVQVGACGSLPTCAPQ